MIVLHWAASLKTQNVSYFPQLSYDGPYTTGCSEYAIFSYHRVLKEVSLRAIKSMQTIAKY